VRRLIVNADDFGLTRGVSEGILAAHRHGIVTSTTVLVTLPVARDLRDRLVRSGMGIGLHVNLTLGRPLTRAPSLVGRDGRFRAFERLFGRGPTHLDTHHHVGLWPPVGQIVRGIARERGLAVRSQTKPARAAARLAGLRTPDHFFGESGPEAYWTLGRTLGRLRGLPPGASEFMTHPGYFDDELSSSRYGRQREQELVGVGSSGARAAAAALGIRLVDFGALG